MIFNKFAGCQKGIKSQGLAKLKKYFQLFGYINNSYDNFSDDFEDYLEADVRNYQLNFNLNVTGELDEPTLKHIVQPRCGNPDIVNGTSTMRGDSSNTFFPNRPRWPPGRNRLTYAFRPANQLSAAVKEAFRRAFDRWTEVTTLTFVETATSYDGADIQIGFYSGDHGDGEPFDGVLGTLAHAFSPPVGRLHMDGEENFRMDTKRRGYEMRNNLCLCDVNNLYIQSRFADNGKDKVKIRSKGKDGKEKGKRVKRWMLWGPHSQKKLTANTVGGAPPLIYIIIATFV
ncbi:hypothetical protein CASFOL_004572 [Castilleja foliolosa]|uniref:Peptidase metallopeptidase domain-containing protein n=1 Tax=Castilleja foliolosa TaxID=1961234 RepID=A0ABD3EAU7_9LAMI